MSDVKTCDVKYVEWFVGLSRKAWTRSCLLIDERTGDIDNDEQMDGQAMGGDIDFTTDRWTDGQTDWQTDGHTDGQTDGQPD